MFSYNTSILLLFVSLVCAASKPSLRKMFKLMLTRYIDDSTEQHLEAEIRSRHEMLYPNNSFVREVLRIMRMNNITIKNNSNKQGNIIPNRRNLDNEENTDYQHDGLKFLVETVKNDNSHVDLDFDVNMCPDDNSDQDDPESEVQSIDVEQFYFVTSAIKICQGRTEWLCTCAGSAIICLARDLDDDWGEYIYDDRTGSCYSFHTENFTWYEASLNCKLEGGHLAVINDETEANVIKELFAKYPPDVLLHMYWWDHVNIGFYDIARKDYSQADFRTVINQKQTLQEAGYYTFGSYQPKQPWCPDLDYYCGAAGRDGSLSAVCCYWTMASICEKMPQNIEDGTQC